MAVLLEVEDVTVRFGGLTALADVSASVSSGEVVGVIGPNGAGKTTLFNVVCGFVRAERGPAAMAWSTAASSPAAPARLARHRTHDPVPRAVPSPQRARQRPGRCGPAREGLVRLGCARPALQRQRRTVVARSRARDAGSTRHQGHRGTAPWAALVRHAEAGSAGARSRLRARPPVARRAGVRAVRDRDERAQRARPRGEGTNRGPARRAPHGPGHGRVRPHHRPRLRPVHRYRHAGRGA